MKTSKEQFIKKWIYGYSSPGEGSDYEDELNSVIAEAIAEHEAEAWHYYPELPEYKDRKILVEYPNGFRVNWDSTIEKNAIRWCELPTPYREKCKCDHSTWNRDAGCFVCDDCNKRI